MRLPHHVAGDPHVVRQRGEDALGRARELVVELVRSLRRHHGDGGLLGAESALDGKRRPRALRLVLGDHVRELARVADGAPVEQARHRAAHVAHHQAQGAADREVGAPAGAEEVIARVDVQLARDGPVDDQQHRGAARRGAGPVVAPARITDPFHRRHHDRHVLGLAARHDRVDGDLLGGDRHRPIPDIGDLGVRGQSGGVQHGTDGRFGGRDDGQAVGPPLLEAQIDGPGGVVDLVALGRERGRHTGTLLVMRRGRHATTGAGVAATARALTRSPSLPHTHPTFIQRAPEDRRLECGVPGASTRTRPGRSSAWSAARA